MILFFTFQNSNKDSKQTKLSDGLGQIASNAVVSGDSNGLLNVMVNYDKVKKFFSINLNAFITVASLKHFGMDTVASRPTKNIIPDEMHKQTHEDKCIWLHNQVSIMLDKYVM